MALRSGRFARGIRFLCGPCPLHGSPLNRGLSHVVTLLCSSVMDGQTVAAQLKGSEQRRGLKDFGWLLEDAEEEGFLTVCLNLSEYR